MDPYAEEIWLLLYGDCPDDFYIDPEKELDLDERRADNGRR